MKAESTLGDELQRDDRCEGLRSAAHAIVALRGHRGPVIEIGQSCCEELRRTVPVPDEDEGAWQSRSNQPPQLALYFAQPASRIDVLSVRADALRVRAALSTS